MATIDDLNLTPYQRIMARMTPAMNPYMGAGQVMGGYDPSFQGGYDPGLYSRLTRSGLINTGAGGMGGGGGDSGGGLPSGPIAPTTPEEFAAQSARNQQINDFLTNISKFSVTGLLTSGLVGLLGGKPQSPAPVENAGGYGGYIGTPSYESGIGIPGESLANEARDQFDANQGAAVGGDVGSISDQNTGGYGGGYGGYSDGGGSDSFGGGEYNMGGLVNRVGGPNPAGPDDGAGMLQLGEYVIKKSAVNKYGQGLLGMINDGKIPAKKMKSLLG